MYLAIIPNKHRRQRNTTMPTSLQNIFSVMFSSYIRIMKNKIRKINPSLMVFLNYRNLVSLDQHAVYILHVEKYEMLLVDHLQRKKPRERKRLASIDNIETENNYSKIGKIYAGAWKREYMIAKTLRNIG